MSTKIGLISDTHMPERWRDIPPALTDIFADVDLILHAGDVGELWVLDKLSQIAPVVAVHGNDDSAESQRELPYKQIVTVAGKRILLWHSHIEDRPTELAFRKTNTWPITLRRLAQTAKRAGANIVVYGHTHIAMATEFEDVLIINPGAIASGNPFQQQIKQSVAILDISAETQHATHYDAQSAESWQPAVDFDEDFIVAVHSAERMIISDALKPKFQRLRNNLMLNDFASFNRMALPLSFDVWEGRSAEITEAMLLNAIRATTDLDPHDREKLLTIFGPASELAG